jgi:VCBS repeat-containing protein
VAVTVAAPAPAAIGFVPPANLIEAASGSPGLATSVATLSPSSQLGPIAYDFKGWTPQGGGVYKQAGAYGVAVLNPAANTLTYTLNNLSPATNGLTTGQTVSETFNIKVSDGLTTAAAPVVFNINGVNDSPVGRSEPLSVAYGGSVTLSAASLLANDSDPEGGALTITAVGNARHGVVTQAANGDVTFTPYLGYTGPAFFSYTITDSTGLQTKVSDQVTVTGTAPTYIYARLSSVGVPIDVSGDGLSHTVLGSGLNDFIYGGAARDILNGDGGNDTISGGGGDDLITGGTGADQMYGASGNDSFVWLRSDVLNTAVGTTDTVYDFAGAGDGRASGDFLVFRGFSPGSSFTFDAVASFNANLFYYVLTDALTGASQFIAVQSLNGQQLIAGDYLFI